MPNVLYVPKIVSGFEAERQAMEVGPLLRVAEIGRLLARYTYNGMSAADAPRSGNEKRRMRCIPTRIVDDEDDLEINELLGEYLCLENIKYRATRPGRRGSGAASASRPSARTPLIHDLMLPDIDGFEVAGGNTRSADASPIFRS